MAGIDFKSLTSALNQRFSQMNGASPFKSTPLTGGSPFSSSTLGGGASPFKQPFGNLQSPFQNPLGGAKSPFNNPFDNVQSPFGGFGQVNSPFGGNPFSTPMNPFRPQAPNGLPSGDDSPLYEGGGGFTGTSDGSGDEGTQKWRPLIEDVARELGISDPDVLQAVMMIESGGVDGLTSKDGAIGLMQVVPKYHAQRVKGSLWEPRNNIYAGAQFLKELYQRYGSWDKAAAGYLGGMNPDGTFNTERRDSQGTNGVTYANMFNENMRKLKAAGVRDVPGTRGVQGNSRLSSMFDGQMFPTTQEFGHTDFSSGAGAAIYDFGSEFGLDGDEHTGWDIGTPVGTNFRMPAGLSGVVTIAGGSGYYTDEQKGNAPGTGELRITLSNGDEIIFGHNSFIGVQVGQRVSAGQLLGKTGWANGAHLHLEVRRRDTSTRSGWRIIDPAIYFGKK